MGLRENTLVVDEDDRAILPRYTCPQSNTNECLNAPEFYLLVLRAELLLVPLLIPTQNNQVTILHIEPR
jgi:hypothetical protein